MKNPWKKLLSNVKISGRIWHTHKGKPARSVQITWEDLKRKFEEQDGLCHYFSIPLDPQGVFLPKNPLAISVDRLDNSKDYFYDNVAICCRMANLGKSTCETTDFQHAVTFIRTTWSQENMSAE